MNQALAIFKKRQRLQGGEEDVSPDTDEQIKALISRYDDYISAQKLLNELDEAFDKRALEIPPILNKLPGQYQNYYPTYHEEVPIKRDRGQRYFDPGSLGEYPIMAQGGTELVPNTDPVPPWLRSGYIPPESGTDEWMSPSGMRKIATAKEASGLYTPGEQSDEDYNAAIEAHERELDPTYGTPAHKMGPRDVYKTVTMNIGGQEMEVPAVYDNMPEDDWSIIRDLSVDQWPKEILDRIEETVRDNLEQGMDAFGNRADEDDIANDNQGHAQGTSDVQHYAEGTSGAQQNFAPWDFFNPWGGTTKGGFNTGVPTQKGIGTAVGTASNFIIPGSGFITGPIARWVTSMIQHGLSRGQAEKIAQQAVQQQQEQPEAPVATAPAPPTTAAPPSAGVGIDPWGNPADPGEWWSNDFNRWNTDEFGFTPGNYNLQGPGGAFGQKGTGFGAGTVGNFSTAIGFGGNFGGGIGAGDTSRFSGAAGYSRPYSREQWANMPGSMKYAAPALSNAFGGVTPRMSYEQYVQGFHAPGTVGSSTGPGGAAYSPFGPKGIGGGTPSFKPGNQKAFAMGTSDVNPGLKLYHRKLLKKPKQKEQTK